MRKKIKQWAWRTLLTLTCLLITTPAWADTWTVAGSESVFGSNWAPSDANNDMSTTDNVNYTWSKSSVALTTSGFEFKVVKNHAWGEAYPSSNYVVSISENANYDIVITFNSDTKAVNATVTKAPDTWTVAGSVALFGSDWSTTDTSNDMTSTDGVTYTWTKEYATLNEGTIEFKVAKNHAWAEAYPASNYKLAISQNGIYNVTITFNSTTKAVEANATLVTFEPMFSLPSGNYDTNIDVSLTSLPGATIYYTTDGSDPTDSDTRIAYNGPISVAGEGEHVIKAVAVDGNNVSDVVTGTYVIKYQNIYLFGSVGKQHAWLYSYNNPELVTSDGITYSGVIDVLNMPDYTDRGGSAALFMLTTGFPDGSIVDEGNNLWNATKPYMIGTTSGNNFWIDGTTNYLDQWVDAAQVGQSDKGWTIIPSNGNGTPYEFFYNKETNQFKLATFNGPTIYVYDYTRPYIYVEDKDHVPYDGVQPGNPIQILDETVGGHSGLSTAANGTGDGLGTLGWYKFSVPSNNYPFHFQFHHNGDKKVIDSPFYEDNAGDVYYYWDGAAYQPIDKANTGKLRRIVAHVRVQGTTVPTCNGVEMNGPSSFYGQMYYWMAVTTYNKGENVVISDGKHHYEGTIYSDVYLEWADATAATYNVLDKAALEGRLAAKTGRGTVIHLLKNKNTPTNQGDYVLGIDTEISTNGTLYNSTNVGATWWGNTITSPWAGTESYHNNQNTISNYNNSRFLYAESGKDGNPDVYTITAENGTEWYTWYSDRSTATIKFGYGTPKEGYPDNYITGGEGAPEHPENVYKFYANYESPQTQQTAGELWYVWTPDFNAELNEVSQNQNNGELIDVTRTYESRAKQKALCSTFRDGNYVYYTDIKGWGDDNVYCYAWPVPGITWPGVKMVKVGYDDEGHPVYLADLSNYDVTAAAAATGGIIFNNGKEELATDKRQTGDLPFENHGCYDYLGLLYRIGGNTDVIDNEPYGENSYLTLRGVWYSRVKGTLFAKGDNDYNNKSENGRGYIDFAKTVTDGQSITPLQASDYDQSNWVEIYPSVDGTTVTTETLIGLLNKEFTLYGTKQESVNPTFTAVSISNVGGGEEEYVPNHFTPIHFNGSPYQYRNGEDEWYFFVEPKPNEYSQIFWSVYSKNDNAFYALSNSGFTGTINVDWSYHDPYYKGGKNMIAPFSDGERQNCGVDPGTLLDMNGYSGWYAIVKFAEVAPSTNPSGKGASSTQFDADDVAPSNSKAGKYIVYPICLTDENVVTAIENIGDDKAAGSRTLISTRYYNMMGVESSTPFTGVNIVVKGYSDGSRESSKVIMR